MHDTLFSRLAHGFLPVFLVAVTLVALTPRMASAQTAGTILIRDTEIENILKEWAKPVIKAAELEPDAIHFILVQNDDLNAFVAGGSNIFIYTGLLLASKRPEEVIGVIAHELGHIRGGHLVRLKDAYKNASYESMLGTLLGIGAAILTGDSGAAVAVSSGAQSITQQQFLTFSRVQESSADQAALTFLDRARMNPDGLVSFMRELENQELLPASQQSAYMRTHPLTRERIETLEQGEKKSRYQDVPSSPEWAEDHARMRAKLKAFIKPERIAWDYDSRDQSIPARYARAIAEYRQNRVENSIKAVDSLLRDEPDNPYFLELKGQILVEFGRLDEALPPYKQAVALAPSPALIRIAYGHALIESAGMDNRGRLLESITQLEQALRDETRSTRAQHLLATAYGRLGNDGLARLHLAEEAFLKRDFKYAKMQAEAAAQQLPKDDPAWLRTQDLLQFIENNNGKD